MIVRYAVRVSIEVHISFARGSTIYTRNMGLRISCEVKSKTVDLVGIKRQLDSEESRIREFLDTCSKQTFHGRKQVLLLSNQISAKYVDR